MALRVAINGFGRIGRLVYRALLERNFLDGEIEVVVVNDLVPADNLAYLLKYDTIHGMLPNSIKALDANTIQVDNHTLKTLAMKVAPAELPWKDYNIDLVIESTGLFSKNADARGHISAGAKKVIISAPSDEAKMYLIGVNDETYESEDVISNASCTTNCIAPLVRVLINEGIGLEEGVMLTAHAYTASQSLQDGPSRKAFRGGRAAAENIIPETTGAANSIGKIIPDVDGKLTGMAIRVPVADGSMLDLTFRSRKDTSIEEINSAMKKASETYLKGILDYTEDPVVSSDFIHNPFSAVYDATASIQISPRFFKLIAWYDNEWGYSNRMVDMLKIVISQT